MAGVISYILLGMLAALLVAAAIGDLRSRTIPNWLNAAVALLAIGWWWADGWTLWPDIGLQILLALMVFLIFAAAFGFGWMGGGDVKLIAALALWFPARVLIEMLVVMALAGGVLTILMLLWHRFRKIEGPPEIPYGVAIVASGFWVVTNDILTTLAS